MKKFIAFLICISMISSFAFCADAEGDYSDADFPQSLLDLRRFEIITLGSLPFVLLDVNLTYASYRWVKNDFDTNYIPNPFASAETNGYTTEEQTGIIITSVCISTAIGLTDLIVNLVRRSSKKKKTMRKADKNIVITPISEDPEAVQIQLKTEAESSEDSAFDDEISLTVDEAFEDTFGEPIEVDGE